MTGDTHKGPWRSHLTWFWIVLLLATFVLFMVFRGRSPSTPRTISWSVFQQQILSRQAVDSLDVLNDAEVSVFIKKQFADDPFFRSAMHRGNQPDPGPHFQFTIGSADVLERALDAAQQGVPPERRIKVNYVRDTGNGNSWITWLLFMILIALYFRLMFRGAKGGTPGGLNPFNFGQSTATLQTEANRSTVTFKDVAGLEEAKQEVGEIVDFLMAPGRYTRLGAKIPRGAIIVGPPGTGKTLLARAVAGEARVPFYSLSGSEFVEMFVGVGASRVRDLFHKAKEHAPCIIFIDEIDAVGRSRSANTYGGANDERESTLNQLLTEMDGFGTNSGVIVLAATNRADMLDPALLRPGRFDRHIYLELPNLQERTAIFRVHLRPLAMGTEAIDPRFLASQTPGFSGADIANLCNEAALFAARRKCEVVEKADFLEAIDRIVAGIEKKSGLISPVEKKVIAYHEAGHAIVSWYLPKVDPLIKVSIIPRGVSLGAAWYMPDEHRLRSAEEFTEGICATLGGRAAEELVIGEVSSGALDDLQKVAREAYGMVAYYGFNKKIGVMSFYDAATARDPFVQKPYSEATGQLIDTEVRQLIASCYERTLEILRDHRAQLDRLATLLLDKEMVFREDLETILGPRTGISSPAILVV